MNRWPDLARRSEALELMDDRSIAGAELTTALRELRWINRLLGAAWPTLEGVARLWHYAGQPARLSLLDIGAGSGDVNRWLLRWAAWRRIDLHITLLDIHRDTCATAATYYRDEPRISVVQGDVWQLPVQRVDIVTAALFIHHFPTPQLPDLLMTMLRTARLGVVVNDLQRHALAWAGIWIATRLLSRSRMIRYDAPLSVQRGFQGADLDRLRSVPGLASLRYAWRPLFRYLLILPQVEAQC